MALGESRPEWERARAGRRRPRGAGYIPQPCPPPHRKTPRSGRWCSASTSCRLSARRASADWRSEWGCAGVQGSVPRPLWAWACFRRACLEEELGPRAAAESDAAGISGHRVLTFTRKAPQHVLTTRRPTPRGFSLLPKSRGGPVSGSPAEVRKRPSSYQSSPLGSGDTSWGPFRWLARVQSLRAGGRGLRVPTCRRGHRQYLRSGPDYDFARYRSTVHEVTQAFAAASREVLAVEAELAGPRRQPLLASHVRSLQELEQTRLGTVRPPPIPRRVPSTLNGSSRGAPLVGGLGGGPSISYTDLTPYSPTSILY